MKIDINNLKANFGSSRFIAVLVPDTFCRKIILISTVINHNQGYKGEKGETAISQQDALNSLHIDLNKAVWKVLKKHKSIKDALDFHNK